MKEIGRDEASHIRSTVFIKFLQLLESAFARMQPRNRTTFVSALSSFKHNRSLKDAEREKVISILGSVPIKKHMIE